MLQVYATNSEGVVERYSLDNFTNISQLNNKWIDLVNPTDREIENLCALTGLPEDAIKAPLDEEERARIEHEDDYTSILFDMPIIEEEEGGYYSYSTLPIGFIFTKTFAITVSLKETAVMRDFVMGRIKTFSTNKRTRFLFQALYSNATKYLAYLKQIDKASVRIQKELNKATKNKELLQLLDLEKSLVYFSTSLKGNDVIIQKLINSTVISKYEEDEELLEDVAIENRQALEMTTIYSNVLCSTMEAYANIINNNLNGVMKILTSVTLLISIPTLIASFFGMNTWVPGQGSWIGFTVVTCISFVISIVVAFILHRRKML